MARFFDPLLKTLGGASETELRTQFLKGENQVLRRRTPTRIRLTVPDRERPARLGNPLGSSGGGSRS